MYWCAARLQPHREALALHCLGLAGYETYYPRLRDRRIRHGRKIELRPALFPGYCFVLIQLQWHTARWAPGTLGLIMDGIQPAKVPDPVIEGDPVARAGWADRPAQATAITSRCPGQGSVRALLQVLTAKPAARSCRRPRS